MSTEISINMTGIKFCQRTNSFRARISHKNKHYEYSFSINKYGHDNALKLAIEKREKLQKELSILDPKEKYEKKLEKICVYCNIEKNISEFCSKNNFCKACKESKLVQAFENKIYPLDMTNKDWQVGKLKGGIRTIDRTKSKTYQAHVTIEKKQITKTFCIDNYFSDEETYKQAEQWLLNINKDKDLIRNQIKILNDNTIEVKISKDKTMITDMKFSDICQKYSLHISHTEDHPYVSMPHYGNFHNYITGFKLVDHINRNTLDNRLINLRDSTSKENANNRNMHKTKTGTGVMGVMKKIRSDQYMAYINQDKKTYTKTFSIKRFGEDEAFRLAIEARKELCERFNSRNGIPAENIPI